MVVDPCTGLTKVAADIAQKSKIVIFSAGATVKGSLKSEIMSSEIRCWISLPRLP
jgi:hypothetical protein